MVDGRGSERRDAPPGAPSIAHRELESHVIDVTRALAILLVLLVHTGLMVVAPAVSPVSAKMAGLLGVLNFGAAGVGLFFVISGYLLNMIYSRGDFAPRKFWVRRFGRIYPAWLFWTAVAIVSALLSARLIVSGGPVYGGGILPDSVAHVGLILLHLGFLGFLAPTMWNSFIPGGWSIQAEMFNYALYPLIRRSRFWVVLLVALAVEVVHFALVVIPNPLGGAWSGITATYLTSPVWFVVGVFLSRVAGAAKRTQVIDDLPLEASLVAGVLAFAVLGGLQGPFVSQATTLAVVIGSIAAAYGIVRSRRWKAFGEIGKYSYGIYFSHLLFLAPLARLAVLVTDAVGPTATKVLAFPMVAVFVAVNLGLSFLVARVVFVVVERRPLEWARRYPRRRSPEPVAPATPGLVSGTPVS